MTKLTPLEDSDSSDHEFWASSMKNYKTVQDAMVPEIEEMLKNSWVSDV